MNDFHSPIDLGNTRCTFCTTPRPDYDKSPLTVPTQHPLRAIAKVLNEAPMGSIVRFYAYSLTDPFVLDLFTHHGNDKTVNVIINPSDYTA